MVWPPRLQTWAWDTLLVPGPTSTLLMASPMSLSHAEALLWHTGLSWQYTDHVSMAHTYIYCKDYCMYMFVGVQNLKVNTRLANAIARIRGQYKEGRYRNAKWKGEKIYTLNRSYIFMKWVVVLLYYAWYAVSGVLIVCHMCVIPWFKLKDSAIC